VNVRDDRLLTAREVGEYLGVSVHTILDWFESGALPGFKLNGRCVRFRLNEVEAWLAGCRRGPRP
jgi:excisionase family DNA binding protein